MNNMSNKFGTILSELIKSRNLSVRKFAQEIGVSSKTASEWTGPTSRFPNSPDTIKKIADYFDVSTHYVMFGEEDGKSLLGSLLQKTEVHTGYYKLTIEKVNINGKKG